MPGNIKRHNHYVPEMYLKSWAIGNKIRTYTLLVPNEKCPVWKARSIEYSASINNLYVRHDHGEERDDFENDFARLYEAPAKVPLMKALGGLVLTSDDWDKLIDFIASQIVRTPAFYFKTQEEMRKLLPEVIDSVAREIQFLTPEQIKKQNRRVPNEEIILPITLDFTGVKADEKSQYVKITAVAGKTTWLFSIRHILKEVAPILHQNRWSVVSAADGILWPTSDDPVICLNRYSNGSYDFNGAWGRQGTEIFLPISPTKGIYTQVGVAHPLSMVLSQEDSLLIKSIIVKHALMYVYSCKNDEDIPLIRPRNVNLEEYNRIKREYEKWYETYQEDEVPYLNPQ